MSQIEQVKKEAVQQVSDELAKQPKQDEEEWPRAASPARRPMS